MYDIYEYKAKKYKYKYKKLKQYISEGGAINYWKLNKNLTEKDFKKLKIKQIYIDPEYKLFFDPKNKSFFDPNIIEKYDERILSCEEYKKENNNYEIISKYINKDEFIKIKSKQIFVGEIKTTRSILNSIKKRFNYNNKTIDESIFKNYDCNIWNDNNNDKYIYIINSKFPDTKLFTEKIQDKTFNIKNFLLSIQNFINNIIIPLYDNGYVFGNIKKENMTLDNDNNIYFIEKTKIHEYDKPYEIREFANKDNYPSILRYFTQIKINYDKNIFKLDFRNFIQNIQNNDIKNIFNKSITDLDDCIKLNKIQDKSINIHYGPFYGNKIKELKKENNVFNDTISIEINRTNKESLNLLSIKNIFNNFIENTKIRYNNFTIDSTEKANEIINEIKYNNNELIKKIIDIKKELIEIFENKKIFIDIYKELQKIYNNENHYAQIEEIFEILKPISKNIDIYAISKLIYDILINLPINDDTKKLIEELYDDAKYNKIENPKVLNERLDVIINFINLVK